MSAQNYSERLKARLCRQYIPCIKEFLTDFDISQTSKNEERHDSLGMGFLVETYDEMNNPEHAPILKANCKWKINDVTEQEIYEAIEEFYYITTWKDQDDRPEKSDNEIDYVNTVSGKRDKLLEYLFRLSIDDDQANIADNTIFAIAEYFGLKEDINQIGNLYRNYECVAYAYYQQIGEKGKGIYDFFNALRLFSSIRNAITHPDRKLGEKVTRYHEYIIFFYIGFVLACRRIWRAFDFGSITSTMKVYNNNTKSERGNKKNTFVCPDYPKHFNIPKESVEIYVGPGPRINVSCKDIESHNIKVNTISKSDNRYSIDICKYKEFIITISDGKNKPLVFKDKLDYNSWFYCYRIKLPEEWFPSSKDYETLSEGTKQLIASVSKHLKESVNQEIKECIGQEFAALQPLIVVAKDKEEKEKELVTILEKLDQFAKGNFEKLEEIHSLIEQSNNTILTELINARKEGDQIKRILSNWSRNLRGASFLLLVVLPVCLIVYNCCFNNIETNICWIKHRIWYYIIATVLIFLTFYLTNPWKSIKAFKKEKSKLRYGITGIVALLLLGCPFAFSYLSVNSFIDNYDFSQHESGDNEKVALLLRDCLDSENSEKTGKQDEQLLRIKLYEYYDHIGDDEARLQITTPMKDVKQFQIGSQYAAEALFKAGKYVETLTIIDNYNKLYKDISKDLLCLKGIMTTFGYGCTQDIDAGIDILAELADSGFPRAQYYYAYVLSHDISKWREGKEKYQLASVEGSPYDLYQAVYWYRKAETTMPEASLELAQLLSSINMTDSALYYYQRAGRGHNKSQAEANYRIGLLMEKITPEAYNDFMEKAIGEKYIPALLYEAQHKKDHKTAIDLYKQLGNYHHYRYIPPIVFEYLALDDDSTTVMEGALEALQKSRPEGHFDMNFVRGMRQLLDTIHVEANHESGMSWMELSAKQGCIYAQMICLFRKMEAGVLASKGLTLPDVQQMQQISKTIPFANVLLSWLFIKSGAYDMGNAFAVMALGKDHHPVGGLMLASIPPEEQNKMLERSLADNNSAKRFSMLRYNEMALRVVPEDQKKQSIYMASELDLSKQNGFIDSGQLLFWCDVAAANNMLGLACKLMHGISQEVFEKDPQYSKRLFNIILDKVDEKTSKDVKTILTYLIYLCGSKNSSIVEELKKEYKNNAVVEELFDPSSLNGLKGIELSSGKMVVLDYVITDQVILDEFGQVVSNDDLW